MLSAPFECVVQFYLSNYRNCSRQFVGRTAAGQPITKEKFDALQPYFVNSFAPSVSDKEYDDIMMSLFFSLSVRDIVVL